VNKVKLNFILFDFDGTLIDTSLGIYKAFKQTCQFGNLEAPSLETFRSSIGPPIRQMLKEHFPDINAESSDILVKYFRYQYDTNFYRLSEWYEGVIDGVPVLSKKFTGLAIVTNKPTLPTKLLLKDAGLLDYFTVVAGIDARGSSSWFTNKTDALSWSLDQLKADASNAIYCGDTLKDKQACLPLSLPFLAVDYGFYKWPKETRQVSGNTSYSAPGTFIEKSFLSFQDALHYLLTCSS
jgi:phosphoglycolate phosphatase